MKEEVIRVEHGCFRREDLAYRFDISISRGECVGVYVDDHLSSGTAYLDVFKGGTRIKSGRAFISGRRVGMPELERWLQQNSVIIDKHRFDSTELTMRDFVISLGKLAGWRQKKSAEQRLRGPESAAVLRQMELEVAPDVKLAELSVLDYYRLCIFRVWFWKDGLLILDRLTEILRQRDLEKMMRCVQLLLGQGAAVILLDLDDMFMRRYSDRIDVVKNRKTCYRLYPEEYGEQLYEILGWKCRGGGVEQDRRQDGGRVVLQASGLELPGTPPLDFQIRSDEIAFLRDETYSTAVRLRDCLLGGQRWTGGVFHLDGTAYAPGELSRLIGTEIGVQLERPDRPDGVLFGNLSALDNLSICLLPKAGRNIADWRIVENILEEASRWFPREDLQRPLYTWPLPQRLRFSYYKWYLLNPRLLICFFPFAGQEPAHHEMIIDMLVTCAERGMAIWVISSGISAICEKTENEAFLRRLRYIN
jgi:ABC-type sugar transport system ATPase subunit